MSTGGQQAADVTPERAGEQSVELGSTRAAGDGVVSDPSTSHVITSHYPADARHGDVGSPVTDELLAEMAAAGAPSAERAVQREPWAHRYRRLVRCIDFGAACIAGVGGFVFRFGIGGREVSQLRYALLLILLPVAWVVAITLNGGYESRVVGAGQEEFRRIFRAFLHLCAVLGVTAFLLRADIARGFILVVLPVALLITQAGRYSARRRLHHRRGRGEALTGVLAVGGVNAILEFDHMLSRDRYAGMRVVGACLTSDADDDEQRHRLTEVGIPVLGDVDGIVEAVTRSRADVVGVLASGHIGSEKLRWISWQLEGTDAGMVVAPGLTEVAGARLHLQPVAGLPLLYVEEPEFSGVRRVAKDAVDRAMASFALIVLAPVLGVIAAAVKLGSRGPVFFAQTRVGRDGGTFRIYKFRSMTADAEQRKAELLHLNQSEGPLFKIVDDPRITRVGGFLRRFSLDELPQLINVIKGDMSLVGPRPALASEVEQYADAVHRRLLVKPGLTGLGQISGRSNLKWDDAVRLDLRYVENWSFTLDLMILWKTIGAVLRRDGAY